MNPISFTCLFPLSVRVSHILNGVTPEWDGVWYQKMMNPDDPYIIPPIDQLRQGQTNRDVEGEVISVSVPRRAKSRNGRDLTVSNSILSDDTEVVKLVQWNRQVDLTSVGDKIRVENASVKSFRGELQIDTGYYGHIIRLD